MLPSLVLISSDGPSFLFHWERRSRQKGPSSCSFYIPFFYLCLLQQMNYLCFFYLESVSLTCAVEVIPSSVSKGLLLQSSLFSTFIFPLLCIIIIVVYPILKKQKPTLIPLHLHSYFFDPLVAKQYSQIVVILWLETTSTFTKASFLTLWVWRIHSFK